MKRKRNDDDVFRVTNIYMCLIVILNNIETGIETGHFIQKDRYDFNRFKERFDKYAEIFWSAFEKESDRLQVLEFGHTLNNMEKLGKLITTLEPTHIHLITDFATRLAGKEFDDNGLIYEFGNVYAEFKYQEVLVALQDNLKKLTQDDLGTLAIWYQNANHVVCDVFEGKFGILDSTGNYQQVLLTEFQPADLLAFNNSVYHKILEGKHINFKAKYNIKVNSVLTLRISEPYLNHFGMYLVTYHFDNKEYESKHGEDWGVAILTHEKGERYRFSVRGKSYYLDYKTV